MKGSAVYKIPEGKLVKVFMDFDSDKIIAISIFGDFFVYPEEAIVKLELGLSGKKLVEEELVHSINKTVRENKMELFGLSAEGLARAIIMARDGAAHA